MLYFCQICNTPFEAFPAAKRKYCSRSCMGTAKTKKIRRVCERCGKEFIARLYKIKAGQGRYCSRDCSDNIGWDEPCDQCGKLVHRVDHHARTQKHVFCSRQCYASWRSQKVVRICNQCGEGFKIKCSKAKVGEGVFCSKKCYNEARAQQLTTLICKQCDSPFQIPTSHLGPNMYQGLYCSSKCKGIARRLPESIRSEYDHRFTYELKEKIRKRDNYTCQLCGIHEGKTPRNLDVHHIDYDKTNCLPINLLSLCYSCHPKTNYNRSDWQCRLETFMGSRDTAN